MRRASEPSDAGLSTPVRNARAVTFNEATPRVPEATRGRNRAAGSDSGRDEPVSLLKDFDSKLSSIQEALAKYQADRTAQARGLAAATSGASGAGSSSGTHPQAAHAGDHTDRPSGHHHSSSGSRRWHSRQPKLQAATVLDEEVFVQHVLSTPRRIKSAAPGASRALSARIEYYRSHMDKAQEKAEKAREEQLAAQREATGGMAGGVCGPQMNFVEANRRSIVPYALPYSLQASIESLRDHGLANMGLGRRGASASSIGYDASRTSRTTYSGRPWSAVPASVRSSVAPSGAPYGSPTAGVGGRAGAWSTGSASGGGSKQQVHVWGLQQQQPQYQQAQQEVVSGQLMRARSPQSPSSSAAANSRASRSWDGGPEGGDGDCDGGADGGNGSSSVFLTAVDINVEPCGETGPGSGPGSRSGSRLRPGSGPGPGPGPGSGFGDANGGVAGTGGEEDLRRQDGMPLPTTPGRPCIIAAAAAAAAAVGRGHLSLSVVLPSRPATAMAGSGAPSAASPTPYSSTSGGYLRDRSTVTGDGFCALPAGGVDMRRLRLALTSRPASGGSPTRRVEFIAEHAARRAERAQYALEVRERAAALDSERRRHIAQAAEVRAAQRREEEARQEAARAAAERQERQRQWTAIVGLCSKLSFIAERVEEDRRLRALRALKKESAVKIATWYKSILLGRRQRELVELIQRLRKLIRPYLGMQKILLRQRAALRIVAFLQYTRTSNMAVVGVRKLKQGVEVLQNAWRNALLVRTLQRTALYNQLTRVEREIVTNNKRTERNLQTQMMKLGKSVNIMEPDSALVPPGFSSGRSHRHLLASTSFRASSLGYTQDAGPAGTASPNLDVGTGGGGANSCGNNTGNNGNNTNITSGGRGGAGAISVRQYDRSRQPYRGVLHDTGDEDDEVLRGHMEMVPREVREQVVDAFLLEGRREHRKLLEQYSADKQLYAARKPIEEMRQKMLRDAGLKVEPEVKPPVMPHMRIIYPRAKIRELLRRAVEINTSRLAAAEERRMQEAAQGGHSWLYTERASGGVLWADLARGPGGVGGAPGERNLAALHGSVSRGMLMRRSVSRSSLRAPSHKTIRLPPPPQQQPQLS